MKNQFTVSVKLEDLANAAAFLRSQNVALRSRNELIGECVRVLADQAIVDGVAVASGELEGIEFLLSCGLAGEASKAVRQKLATGKIKSFTADKAIAAIVVERIKEGRKLRDAGIKEAASEQDAWLWLEMMSVEFEDSQTLLSAAEKRFTNETLTPALRQRAAGLFTVGETPTF